MRDGIDKLEDVVHVEAEATREEVRAVGQVHNFHVSPGLIELIDSIRRWSILVGAALPCNIRQTEERQKMVRCRAT